MTDKTIQRKIWWSLVAVYLAVLYSSIGIAPGLWDILNGALGGKGSLVIYACCFFVAFLFLGYMVFIRKERAILKYLWMMFVGMIFIALNKVVIYPAEKIHLIEYFVLGFLLYRALVIDLDRYDIKLYVSGILFCVAAGILDEVIQWFLPNRVFDWRDIFLNNVSSIIAFLAVRIYIKKEQTNIS